MSGPELACLVHPTAIFSEAEMIDFFKAAHTASQREKPKLAHSTVPRGQAPEVTAAEIGLEPEAFQIKVMTCLADLVSDLMSGKS